jgi:hypothetical protein
MDRVSGIAAEAADIARAATARLAGLGSGPAEIERLHQDVAAGLAAGARTPEAKAAVGAYARAARQALGGLRQADTEREAG